MAIAVSSLASGLPVTGVYPFLICKKKKLGDMTRLPDLSCWALIHIPHSRISPARPI